MLLDSSEMTLKLVFLILLFCDECSGCGDNCVSCESASQFCEACKTGFWGLNGTCKSCPDNCEQCTDEKNCSKCKAVFWGTGTCSNECPENCDGSGCDDETGQCYKCQPGFYGIGCQQNCTMCTDGLCNMNGTSNNCTVCAPGTYGSICQHTCSEPDCYRCNYVDSIEKCTECVTGFVLDGKICVLNITCSNNCANGCTDNGQCVNACKDGWSGQTCTEKCSSQCKTCEQTNHKMCTECDGDFYTSQCNSPCSEHCSGQALEEKCRLEDGFCLNGCLNGYWGDKCDKSCHTGCSSTHCSQAIGLCANCHRSFYGLACEYVCSDKCVDNGISSHICNKIDGRCVLGCKDGYSGNRCAYTTSTTSRETAMPTTDNTHSQQCKQEGTETKFFLFGILAGVGITLSIVAGIGTIMYLRRRRILTSGNKDTLENDGKIEYKNTTFSIRELATTQKDNENGRSVDAGNAGTNVEQLTPLEAKVYEQLQDNKCDNQHQYSDWGGQQEMKIC